MSTAIQPKRSHLTIGVAVFLYLLILGTAAALARPAHEPAPPRPLYWGAQIGDQLTGEAAPWDMRAVFEFERLAGKPMSLVSFSSPFAECAGAQCTFINFPTTPLENVRGYGAIPFLGWSSSATPEGEADQRPFRLAKIIDGSLDPFIRRFAESAREWGHPFFLRFDWEMNGFWFPWSEGVNNRKGAFVQAWRHVHDIFAAVGATNATWVWCVYADASRRFARIAPLYPGDGYVDWTCMDGYNWGRNPTNPQKWRSFGEIFAPTYRRLKRIAPGKPIVLAEMASTGSHRAKAAWIRDMFAELRTRFRGIRGLIWFDQVDRNIDWPLETSSRASRAFAKGIRHKSFRANHYASIFTTPLPPP